MPRAPVLNGFCIFMTELKRRLEAQGDRFPGGLADVVDIANEQWSKLSSEQKQLYKDKAKDLKHIPRYAAEKRSKKPRKANPKDRQLAEAIFVEPDADFYFTDNEEAEHDFHGKREHDRREIMYRWIWNFDENKTALEQQKFFILSFIPHCRDSSYSYYPAEAALVEFSLRDGCTNQFWTLLGPYEFSDDLLPKVEEAHQRHQIPFRNDERIPNMTDDYQTVFEKMLRILRPSKNVRRLFCLNKEYNTVQGCLRFLQVKAELNEIQQSTIACCEDLLALLYQWKDKVLTRGEGRVFDTCDGLSQTCPFFGNPELLCEYHKERGIHYCALATAKRAMYYTLERAESCYPFIPTDKHCPPEFTPAEGSPINLNASRAVVVDDDDDSGLPIATGFTPAPHYHAPPTVYVEEEEDELGWPDTWPDDLAGPHKGSRPPWRQQTTSTSPPESREPPPPVSNQAASTTSSESYNFRTHYTNTQVHWGQNKSMRDRAYAGILEPSRTNAGIGDFTGHRAPMRSPFSLYCEPGAVQAWMESGDDFSNNGIRPMEARHTILIDSTVPAAARPIGIARPLLNPQVNCGNTIGGTGSNLTTEFNSGIRPQQPPVAFPPPQNVTPIAFPATTNFSAGAHKRSFMAPRIALPPSQLNEYMNRIGGARFQTSVQPRQQAIATPAVDQFGTNANITPKNYHPQPVMNTQPGGVPQIRTQSRVKAMVMEKLGKKPQF